MSKKLPSDFLCCRDISATERSEAGEPTPHECLQDERASWRRGHEGGGERAEAGESPGSPVPLKTEDGWQGDTGHPRAGLGKGAITEMQKPCFSLEIKRQPKHF